MSVINHNSFTLPLCPSAPLPLAFPQIKAQVAAIRKKIPNTRTVGIRTKEKWTGNTRHEVDGETYLIHQCDSPLAMRLALRESGEGAITVLMTDLNDSQIADDILVRLKPRKLVPLDSWQIVKSLFQARTIDPRIVRHGWIAETLMEHIPAEGFAPVASGFLDAETVWAILLSRMIGLDGDRPDMLALLKWSTDPDNSFRFRGARVEFQNAASEWLAETAGPAVTMILRCAASQDRPDILPIGLAAGVVFDPQAKGKVEKAAGKLEERYLGGQSPDQGAIERWAAAATEVVRLQISDSRLKQQLLQRADEILREVGAETYASLSNTSPLGFDLRLAEFGKRLSEVISQPQMEIQGLGAIRETILQHDRHSRERRRLERIDMAMRLVRWLMSCKQNDSSTSPSKSSLPAPRLRGEGLGVRGSLIGPKSLAEAASYHLAEGGYADWARLSLRSGEPVRALSEAYARLFEVVTEIRERQSWQFAELLHDWIASKTTDEMLVPVEQVLERIVAPIAAHKPVLVIVVDGMSVAVFRELMADVLGHDWLLLAEQGVGLRPVLATIPSVTEFSRTSLLCGRLAQGDAATERTGFSEHAGLLQNCRSGSPPVLFHKAALQESEDASLAGDIRREISSSHRRIVGVVVNAVDDHLLKGEQIDTRWSRDEIKVLPVLMHEAKSAGRVVIMISDHGHVLDCNTAFRPNTGGERWRADDGELKDGELQIAGPRVVGQEAKRLVALWTEKVRFGLKKNGYHGGINPQEMVVPIAVLASSQDVPPGWAEAPVDSPQWWDLDSASPTVPTETEGVHDRAAMPPSIPRGYLFDVNADVPPPPSKTSESVEEAVPEWIDALLGSPIYEQQERLGGRAVPDKEVMSRLLVVLGRHRGKITSAALARALQLSPLRLRGLLAAAARVLNVDGYAILTRDSASDTVEFDESLLGRQFDLRK